VGTRALRITSGTRHFTGATALYEVDLEVHAGEFLAVLGRSGSGKSSLLRIIAGLDTLTSGTITWDGDGNRPRTGVVFQQPALMPWLSVVENVGFARRFAAQRGAFDADYAAELMARFGLEALTRRFPDELSGGQAQRVAILRAVATRPRLLLLDEPFSALDPATRRDLQGWLGEVAGELDVTVVLVTHDVDEALALAQRIVLLDGGGIVRDWTLTESGAPTRAEIVDHYRTEDIEVPAS
jgi:ABC-type nitrate/sulfonate/bicarbonate transport system ATPase subunit